MRRAGNAEGTTRTTTEGTTRTQRLRRVGGEKAIPDCVGMLSFAGFPAQMPGVILAHH